MTILIATTVGARKDTGRIWLEGTKLERGGFHPDTPYVAQVLDGVLYLKSSEQAKLKVSRRKSGDVIKPIIDLCNKMVSDTFPIGTALLAIVAKGKIIIRRAVQPLLTLEREHRFMNKLKKGEALNVGDMFHGGGVMARSIHDGLTSAGIKTRSNVICEIDGNYIDASLRANSDLFDDQTLIINGPIQNFRLGKIEKSEIMHLGIPCTGASPSGRAKLKLSSAEAHPEAGALFFSALQMIDKFQPAVLVIENVVAYKNTAGMEVIRSVLGGWGYELFETTLNGVEFGALENRNRLVVIGISKGLSSMGFDLSWITPTHTKPMTVAEVLEPIDEDDDSWRTFEYLAKKEVRDLEAGKGFRRQLYAASDESVNTITRDYMKARSTDPFLKHPTKADHSRLFSPVENARIKGLPEGWVESLQVAATTAHQILGQGVIYPVFHAIGNALGRWIQLIVSRLQSAPIMTAVAA